MPLLWSSATARHRRVSAPNICSQPALGITLDGRLLRCKSRRRDEHRTSRRIHHTRCVMAVGVTRRMAQCCRAVKLTVFP